MAKRGDVPTRGEVTEKIETKKTEMDAKEVDLDKVAADVETVRQTLESLDFGGTQEGSEQVEQAIEGAEEVTEQEFDKEDEALEEIQADTQEYEGGLGERRGSSESDLGKISDASAGIETNETVSELVKAKEAALRDIEFLAEEINRAQDAVKESDAAQESLHARVHSKKGR